MKEWDSKNYFVKKIFNLCDTPLYLHLIGLSVCSLAVWRVETPFDGASLGFPIWQSNPNYYYSIKTIGLALVSFFLIPYLICSIKKNWSGTQKRLVYIALALISMVILSTVYSEYPTVTLTGFPSEGENSIAHISFYVLFLSAISFFTIQNFRLVVFVLSIISILIFGYAILQYFGLSDYLDKLLYVGFDNVGMAKINKVRNFGHEMPSTVGLSNDIAWLSILLMPIFYGALRADIVIPQYVRRVVYSALILSVLVVFFTNSKAAIFILGANFAIILFFVLWRSLKLKWFYKVSVSILSASILLFVACFFYLKTDLRDMSLFLNSKSHFRNPIQTIGFKRNQINLVMAGRGTVIIKRDEYGVYFTNKQGRPLKMIDLGGSQFKFESKNFGQFRIKQARFGDLPSLDIKFKKLIFSTAFFQDEILLVNSGKLVKTRRGPTFPKFIPDSLFSGRGFIWSRGIPMLKDSKIIGSGAGVFPIKFPQYDLVGKLNAFGKTDIIVSKPHNQYIQMAYSWGGVYLLLFLALILFFLTAIVKAIYRNFDSSSLTWVRLGIFLGVSNYLLMGILNDSSLAVAPIFWSVLGLGFSLLKVSKTNLAHESFESNS